MHKVIHTDLVLFFYLQPLAAMQAATAPPKPIRKPDPDLRTLQRQISFGSVSGFPGISSLKKRPMSQGTYQSFHFKDQAIKLGWLGSLLCISESDENITTIFQTKIQKMSQNMK